MGLVWFRLGWLGWVRLRWGRLGLGSLV